MVKFFSLIIDFRDETRQAEQGLSSKKCLTVWRVVNGEWLVGLQVVIEF